MLSYLLQRPVAVGMGLFVSLAISLYLFFKIPVSLLPALDVPLITVTIQWSNAGPEQIEQDVLKPAREAMLTLAGLKSAESVAHSESGKITLRFDHGTNMNLAYIEVNEKIDRLQQVFPRTIDRPTVVKSNTSDIPVARLQIGAKFNDDLVSASEFVSKVLKRRLEQISGVGLVDMNGLKERIVQIVPEIAVLASLGLSESDITRVIQNANVELGSLTVKDGNYQHFLKLASSVRSTEEIGSLIVQLPGNTGNVQLRQIAKIQSVSADQNGAHLFQAKDGIVVTIHKQSQARLPELMPRLYHTVEQLSREYPQFTFQISQDQSLLLKLSIENLTQSLLWGGAFAFAVLFMFMRGWKEPVIMGIVLPLSLVLCFSLFSVFNVSLNIISLSGLALGLGMLVDNSIVVIDSIQLKRKASHSLLESCVLGTEEVIVPLMSSALTNLVVFLPLVFLSGITGALFFDQAVAVGSILAVSLVCTFIVVPLLYLTLFNTTTGYIQPKDSAFFLLLKEWYSNSFSWVWNNKKISFAIISLLIPLSFLLLYIIPKEGFPEIERTETIISIDWNEPIGADECLDRTIEFLTENGQNFHISEAEVGYQQFLLSHDNFSPQHADIYLKYQDPESKMNGDKVLKRYLETRFPLSSCAFKHAPNAFEQIFSSEKPVLEARFRDLKSKHVLPVSKADSLLGDAFLKVQGKIGKGFERETMAYVTVDFSKLELYGIAYATLIEKLKVSFGEFSITDFKDFGEIVPVVFAAHKADFNQALQEIEVQCSGGTSVPIREVIQVTFLENYKYITADGSGVFQSIHLEAENIDQTLSAVEEFSKDHEVMVDFEGTWFEDKENLIQLATIMAISIFLMYFILTAEFESLKLPLLVLITLPLGLAGSLLSLWIAGGTLNIMSGIGLIVVLGVLDNDAILKIDRINRLRNSMSLEAAIREAGKDRFKPIVMNTCTNVLAVTPILLSSGLGSDLQAPVALTTVGGLIVGTFTALYFIPLIYFFTHRDLTNQPTP
jgi:multidrug efflux pump subunit AcrB